MSSSGWGSLDKRWPEWEIRWQSQFPQKWDPFKPRAKFLSTETNMFVACLDFNSRLQQYSAIHCWRMFFFGILAFDTLFNINWVNSGGGKLFKNLWIFCFRWANIGFLKVNELWQRLLWQCHCLWESFLVKDLRHYL